MDRVLWQQVREVFGAAMQAPKAMRSEVIAARCGSNEWLRKEVTSLVEAAEAADQAAWHGPRNPLVPFAEPAFLPDRRFSVDARIGAGGFGVVYRAYDHQLERWLALKTLRENAPAALARLKREFRALADISHPNLLRLYELFVEDRQVYFSMELVEGRPFDVDCISWEPGLAGEAWPRLAGLLTQLADGISALHAHGVMHRDLKPSNVLVTIQDRIVILDFGLVVEVADTNARTVSQVAGTPAYMAPECLAGQCPLPASDWYSFGALLTEILASVARRRVEVPALLEELARDLTAADPGARPGAAHVLERLARLPLAAGSRATADDVPTGHAVRFVGRCQALSDLERSFARTCAGELTVTCVHGPSGIGKTALVHHFIALLRTDPRRPLVFWGRCHEREAVVFKAFDGIIDGLSRHLRRLPLHEASALLPNHIHDLARLFPALLQAPAVRSARRRLLPAVDSVERRKRGFEAFRELLTRVAHTAPVILFIDDLQWGDLDSAAFLRHLLRGPRAPALCVVVAWRSLEKDGGLGRGALSEMLAASTPSPFDVLVPNLSNDEVRQLATEELGDLENAAPLVEAVVREAAGIPIFAHELLREAQRTPSRLMVDYETLELDAVLTARLARLPTSTRQLLETICLATKAVARQTARRASELEGTAAHDAEQTLLASKLLRLGDEAATLEAYHDRIRELVVRLLSPDQAVEIHRCLARAFEARGDADPEDLAYHFKAAGEREEAAAAATQAAVRAADNLAFARSAALYETALELRSAEHPEAGALAIGLADALANAGRSSEAAEAYLLAAARVPAEHLSLVCKAAEHLLQSGEIARGSALVRELLAGVGWRVPRNQGVVIASIVLRRLQIMWRGLDFDPRSAEDIAPDDLVRLDASWALVSGLSLCDTVNASYFQNHFLLQALAAGEPRRLLRALSSEAAYCAMPGTRRSRRRAEKVLNALRDVADRFPHEPIAEPSVAAGVSMVAWMNGQWKLCQTQARVAERGFRESCMGVTWELCTMRSFLLSTLTFLGDYATYDSLWPGFIEDARSRGDFFAETNLLILDLPHASALAKDRPDESLAAIDHTLARWKTDGFYIQHFWALYAKVEAALYRGEARAAWDLIEASRAPLRGSRLLWVQSLRVWFKQTRARAALAVAAQEPSARPRMLRLARREALAIRGERHPWCEAMAEHLLGLAEAIGGDREAAMEQLMRAATQLDGADMPVYAAAARRAQGQLAGPHTGARWIVDADELMHARGIVEPSRFSRMLAPCLSVEERRPARASH